MSHREGTLPARGFIFLQDNVERKQGIEQTEILDGIFGRDRENKLVQKGLS